MGVIYGKPGRKTSLGPLKAQIINAIWPPLCAICQAETADAQALCLHCWSELPLLAPPSCRFCAAPIEGSEDPICLHCWNDPRAWDAGFAAAHYHNLAREMVLRLKTDEARLLAPVMAKIIYQQCAHGFDGLDALIAMPLHWRRYFARGFNQAETLAAHLSSLSGVPHLPFALKRTRPTKKQSGAADYQARFDNLAAAIAITPHARAKLAGKRIGIVDDVLTSGASLENASAPLRALDVKEIRVFVFAHAARSD